MVIFILVRLWDTFMALRKYPYFFLTVWESFFYLRVEREIRQKET